MTKLRINSIPSKPLEEIPSSEGNQNDQETPTCSTFCSKFGDCSAPLCPVDLLDNATWFSDEEICGLRAFAGLPWILMQKKVSKKCRDTSGYFNLTMLKHDCIVRGGILGLDPDSLVPQEKLTKQWIKDHPVKPEVSKEERKIRAERLKSSRQDLTTIKTDAQPDKNIEKHPLRTGDLTSTISSHDIDPNELLSSNLKQK